MKNSILIILSVVICLSCKKKDDTEVKTTGDGIISSQILGDQTNYYVEGFSFEKGTSMKFSITSGTKPDIILNYDQGSNLVSISSPSNVNAFFLAGEYESLEAAETAYNNLKDLSNKTFVPLASNIKAFQVYGFQTLSGKYAKFVIKDLKPFTDPTKYAEISIDWKFQPDGTAVFP